MNNAVFGTMQDAKQTLDKQLAIITGSMTELMLLAAESAIQAGKAQQALKIMRRYNGQHNDLDAYLIAVTEWGLGERTMLPKLEDFGLAAEVEDE